jgi:phosphonopyruvate decarboxylase
MISASDFCETLAERGYTFYTGVPCSYFKQPINYVLRQPRLTHVMAANEGAALAIAAGAWLSGRKCVLMIQNSGLGNLINPLTSLLAPYRIPAMIFVSGRAYPDGTDDEPQHLVMGAKGRGLLASIGVHRLDMPDQRAAFAAVVADADAVTTERRCPVVVMVPKGTIGGGEDGGEGRPGSVAAYPMRRQDAIRVVAEQLLGAEAVVSTTGMISRELFGLLDREGNFYMQGSMGHARSIGLGIALSQPGRKVVVLDGDGAALMHMGSLSTVGHYAPAHILDVVLDNEAHGTTGYQDTTSSTTRLDLVARACNYRAAYFCTTPEELAAAVVSGLGSPGPTFILAKVNRVEAPRVPRVTARYTPDATADIVRQFLSQPPGDGRPTAAPPRPDSDPVRS